MMETLLTVSHLMLTVSYLIIPAQFLKCLIQSPHTQKLPWRLLVCLRLIALFFVLCATTHLLVALGQVDSTLYKVVLLCNGAVSMATALYFIPFCPQMFQLLDESIQRIVESKSKLFTFMAFLCHEIRNPLFCITSSAECLQDTCLSQEQTQQVSTICDSSQLMLRLVHDVLDLSKLDSGNLETICRPFDLHALLQRLGDNMARQVQRKHNGRVQLNLNVDKQQVPQIVWGDSTRLLQIIYNLLSNSSKFTPEGTIGLTVSAMTLAEAREKNLVKNHIKDGEESSKSEDSTSWYSRIWQQLVGPGSSNNNKLKQQQDSSKNMDRQECSFEDDENESNNVNQVLSKFLLDSDLENGSTETCETTSSVEDRTLLLEIQVSDTGIGIPSHRLKDLFEPYTQAKLSHYRQHGGTGLGLSIISSLTKSMGGTISVTSTEGKGSTFCLRLPVLVTAPPEDEELENIEDAVANEFMFAPDVGGQVPSLSSFPEAASIPDASQDSQGPCSRCPGAREIPEATPEAYAPTENDEKEYSFDSPISTRSTVGIQRLDHLSSVQVHPASPSMSQLVPFELPTNDSVVLIVDDNEINRKIVARMLSTFNIEYQMACDGREAVDMLLSSRNNPKHNLHKNKDAPLFGLVLMDISMPVLDGNEAIVEIRAADISVPIVALSANVLSHEKQRTISLGANEYNTKPILRKSLYNVCTRYLGESATPT